MLLQQEQQIAYLGNVVFLAFSDGSASSLELAALEEVRAGIGARKSTMETALKIARDGAFAPILVGGFADQVNNLSDMLYVAIVDGDLSETEKKIISGMSRDIGLSQEQTLALTRDAIGRWQTAHIKICLPVLRNASHFRRFLLRQMWSPLER